MHWGNKIEAIKITLCELKIERKIILWEQNITLWECKIEGKIKLPRCKIESKVEG